MCMEDVNIDRALRTNIYAAAGASTNIPANPDRLSIRLVSIVESGTYGRLTAQSVIVGSAGPVNGIALLGVVTNEVSGAITGRQQLVDDITLARVGVALKGPLILTEQNGGTVFAIETYLPVNDGQSLDIGKLP